MLRALSRRLLALVALVALVMSLGRGLAFLWCPGMQEVVSSCCCASKQEPPAGPAVERKGCCEAKSLPDGAPAVGSSNVIFGPAVALAEPVVLDPVAVPTHAPFAGASIAEAKGKRFTFARAGPRAPLPILNCSLLC